MVRDYVTNLYIPAAASAADVEAASGGAAALAEWKRRVRSAWDQVAVDHVESLDGDQVEVGAKIHVATLVRLGELSPDDVEVQLVTGRMDGDDHLYEPRVNPFAAGVEVDGGLRRYEGWVEAKRAGAIGYTVRVVPHHRLLANVAEMGLVTLPAAQTTAPPDFTPMRLTTPPRGRPQAIRRKLGPRRLKLRAHHGGLLLVRPQGLVG